jgi:D-glycero-D-manno-heptose 1,7-bisphosphate phosphatase
MSGRLIILVGFPASGKSTYVEKLKAKYPKNGVVLSRDDVGGTIANLLPKARELLVAKKTVILDNTNITRDARKPFIALGKELGARVTAIHLKNTIEDSQIKALHRMYQKYGEIFWTGKGSAAAATDPGVFPPAALFAARKRFEAPSTNEGFDEVTVVDAEPVKWDDLRYRGKAVFFDIDGTLRETSDLPLKYPTKPEEVQLLKNYDIMAPKLRELLKHGYKLIGVSNQSGINKKTVTETRVAECMQRTRDLLDLTEKEMPIKWCPHNPAPISCYCRKPQVGMFMHYVENMKLNPKECIMVGDSKTDETAATRMGMRFIHSKVFWCGTL